MSIKTEIINSIKEIIKIMEEDYRGSGSSSFEIDDKYFHFKVLDITDYEQNHYGYSVKVNVTDENSNDSFLNFECFYDDENNSIKMNNVNNKEYSYSLNTFIKNYLQQNNLKEVR